MMRIAITGPESSGKSTLSIALAKALGCAYLPEFARFYLQEKDATYKQADLNTIIEEQINWIREATADSNQDHVIADTDFFVLEIWEEVKFKSCSLALHQAKQSYSFDLILLCYPDIPWEADPLRESQGMLEPLYLRYLEKVENSQVPFGVIRGTNRLQQALEIIANKKGR